VYIIIYLVYIPWVILLLLYLYSTCISLPGCAAFGPISRRTVARNARIRTAAISRVHAACDAPVAPVAGTPPRTARRGMIYPSCSAELSVRARVWGRSPRPSPPHPHHSPSANASCPPSAPTATARSSGASSSACAAACRRRFSPRICPSTAGSPGVAAAAVVGRGVVRA